MKKHDHVAQPVTMDEVIKNVESEKVAIEDMPLNTIRDYRLYNEEARRLNKKLRICRYTIKQCPEELHPKQRVVFRRNDQPENPLPVFLSDDRIHFEKTLVPGRTYDLPECIVDHLANKGDPIWAWVDLPNGERETRVVSKKPRFSLMTIYQAA